MSKSVVLSFGNGDFSQGFSTVTALLWMSETSRPQKFTGSLPATTDIPEIYRSWKLLYQALSESLRNRSRLEVEPTGINNVSEADLLDLCEQLQKEINTWLRSASFNKLEMQLRTSLNKDDEIRLIIDTDNDLLRSLPWHLWDFFNDYPLAEVGLSASEWQYQSASKTPTNQVKILAILGNSHGIDVEKDKETLQQLRDADVTFLKQPERKQLNDQLWEQSWDILFFAGHSNTIEETGLIYINQTESLTIDQLKFSLQKAIKQGLQLAIFNSCDGLGLASQLGNLHIPQLIVMREPVPDFVAQEFLKNFLREFAGGKSLYTAVREARQSLQGLEGKFPCASWLPVICQNPVAVPPTWQQLRDGEETERLIAPLTQTTSKPSRRINPILQILTASFIATLSILGVRQVGVLQQWELQTFDQMIRLRPDEGKDNRFLVVTVTEDDFKYQDREGMQRKWSLSDKALAQLLKKLRPLEPRVIGIDIYHEEEIPEQSDLAKELSQTDNFIAICKQKDIDAKDTPGIRPPNGVPEDRIGFSDVVRDSDKILRRHLWYSTPNTDSPCLTEKAFSLYLAIHYLAADGILPERKDDNLQIGNTTLKLWQNNAGAYRNLQDSYQMLLNYRSRNIANSVTLEQVLTGQFDPNLVRDKIVIIGVTAPSVKDDFDTPYGVSMRGVFIQAQMASQIISAVLDKRPLLWVLPEWGDAISIWAWSVVGAVVAWQFGGTLKLSVGIGGTVVIIYGGCFLAFWITGCWLPVVPSALVVIATSGAVLGYSKFQAQLK